MDRRAVSVSVLTVAALTLVAVTWWALGSPSDTTEAAPAPAAAPAPVAALPAPPPAPVAADDEPEVEPVEADPSHQQLGPIPGLAGRDGTDPEVRAELLDHIEQLEAERLGPEEAKRRREVREVMLEKRINRALGED